jgi:hypothetical protein
MVEKGDERLVYEDETGAWRFNETLVNGYALTDCLTQIDNLSLEIERRSRKYTKRFSPITPLLVAVVLCLVMRVWDVSIGIWFPN